MDRRIFARNAVAVLAAFGLSGESDADVIDPGKKSKAVVEEENRIEITILGFDSEKAGDRGFLKDARLWWCKYQVKRLDGSIVTKTTANVLSTNKAGVPPSRFQFDLS